MNDRSVLAKTLLTIAVAVVSVVAVFLGSPELSGPDVAHAASVGPSPQAVVPDGTGLVAENSIHLKQNATINGNVLVNEDGTPPFANPNNTVEDVTVSRNATINGNLTAESIELSRNANINGSIFTNVLDDKGANCNPAPCAPPAPNYTAGLASPLPNIGPARPGAPDINVAAGQTVIVPTANPGDREIGNITIAEGGALVFPGGTFHAQSVAPVSTQGGQCPFPCRSVLFSAPGELVVADRFDTGRDSKVGPQAGSGVTASQIVIQAEGSNGGTGLPSDVPAAATVGRDSLVDANFIVPNGTLLIDRDSTFTGGGVARDIVLDSGVTVHEDSAFLNQPPIAIAESVFTDGVTPIQITLRGRDPEGEGLTFSIEVLPQLGTLTDRLGNSVTTAGQVIPGDVPQCSDGLDNDSDGNIDLADAQCQNASDNDESADPPPGDGRNGGGVGAVLVQTATVTYTPTGFDPNNPLADEDGFTFGVKDTQGAMSTAVVGINGIDNSPAPPGLTEVDALDFLVNPDPQDPTQLDAVGTGVDIPVIIGLLAGAPASVTSLTFRIETDPTGGSLTSGGNPVNAPADITGNTVLYTPPPGQAGTFSFTYSARDSMTGTPPCNSPSCDTATVEIVVAAAAELAPDRTLTTTVNQPVQFVLAINPGGTGTGSLRAGPGGINAALPIIATVAGGVADVPPEDGTGDVADVPPLVAAGVEVAGSGNPSGSVTDPTGDQLALTPPLRWTLVGVTLDDGGSASGTFDYNAATETVTNWNISVAGGNTGTFPPLTYTPTNSTVLVACLTGATPTCPATQEKTILFQETGGTNREFRITPEGAFTNTGGTLPVDLNTAGGGSGAVECFNCVPARSITAGSVSAPQASDLTSVDLSSDGTNLAVDIRFDSSTFNGLFTGAFVYLDLDQNVATGCDIDEDALTCTPGASDDPVGWEYRIQIPKPQSGFNTTLIAQVAHFSSVGLFSDVPLTIESDGFTLSVPLANLGGDDGVLNFLVESFAHSGPQPSPGNATPSTTGIDFAPDGGAGSTQGELRGSVRIQIEFDTSGVPSFSPNAGDRATVTLTTVKDANSSVDTQFFFGGDSQSTPLTLASVDFEEGATSPLPNVVMPVPGVPDGTEGTFSFDVTSELESIINGIFSLQGRVDETLTGENQGLQVHTTSAGKEPLLVITSPEPQVQQIFEILSLPLGGTLRDTSGNLITLNQTFIGDPPTLVYTANVGTTGDSFNYQITFGSLVDSATVSFIVAAVGDCLVDQAFCDDGRP